MFKKINKKIDDWLFNCIPRVTTRKLEDGFAFKDDQEMSEVYDEILDNRRSNTAFSIKMLIILYVIGFVYLCLIN